MTSKNQKLLTVIVLITGVLGFMTAVHYSGQKLVFEILFAYGFLAILGGTVWAVLLNNMRPDTQEKFIVFCTTHKLHLLRNKEQGAGHRWVSDEQLNSYRLAHALSFGLNVPGYHVVNGADGKWGNQNVTLMYALSYFQAGSGSRTGAGISYPQIYPVFDVPQLQDQAVELRPKKPDYPMFKDTSRVQAYHLDIPVRLSTSPASLADKLLTFVTKEYAQIPNPPAIYVVDGKLYVFRVDQNVDARLTELLDLGAKVCNLLTQNEATG